MGITWVSRDAAPSWKAWEGIRELVQNWHDGLLTTQVTVVQALAARNPELARRMKRGEQPSILFSRVPGHGSGGGTGAGTGAGAGSAAGEGTGAGADDSSDFIVSASVLGQPLGWLQYIPSRKALLLVNRGVGLSRKV